MSGRWSWVIVALTVMLASCSAGADPSKTSSVAPSPSASPLHGPSAAIEPATITLRLLPTDGHLPTVAELQSVADVLRVRLSVLEDSPGATIRAQEGDRMTVDIDVPSADPGYLGRVTEVLTAPGQVRFVPLGSAGGQEGQVIDPAAVPLFGGEAVAQASISSDQTGTSTLDLALSSGAADTFATWSAAHLGSQFAITLDGTIVLAPVVQSPITDGRLTVTSPSGRESLLRLAAVLRSGPLPILVVLVPS